MERATSSSSVDAIEEVGPPDPVGGNVVNLAAGNHWTPRLLSVVNIS
jgi:hypothetical protein